MNSLPISNIEVRIAQLPLNDQLQLLERMTKRIRETMSDKINFDSQALTAMAADPDIQKELQEIEKEFSFADSDGLRNL